MKLTRAAAVVAPALSLFLSVAAPAWAHIATDTPIHARLVGSERGTPKAEDLVFEIGNNTEAALTLTKLRAPGGRTVRLERRREIFGVETWQPVKFLRLEPGRSVVLAPPDYRLIVDPDILAQLNRPGGGVTAVFSPFGPVVVLYEGPDSVFAPPAPADASAQTTE